MAPSRPAVGTAAILLLLLVGVGLSFSFHAAVSGGNVTYTATAVDPGDHPELLTRAANNATNLTDRLSGTPRRYREPIRTAATAGAYDGSISTELYIVIEDLETPYVWHEGRYYAWSVSTEGETTSATIRMQPTDLDTVLAAVAEPVETAPETVQEAIESGTASDSQLRRGIYRQDGRYYAVVPETEGAVATMIAGTVVGFVLTPVGRGYTAAALGLLGYRYRNPSADRLLTVRRAAIVAASAVPVALVGTALFESGSATRFVTGPASAFTVATGVVAGVLAAQQRGVLLIGLTLGVGLLTSLAVTAVVGPVGLFLGPLTVLIGVGFGTVPFGYGYWFSKPADTDTQGSSD